MSGIDIISYKLGQKRGGGSGGGGSVRLQNKTFNANGTYKADAGYDGLGTVTVDVAGSGCSDEDWIIGDGNTHLWISLPEGRTSPMLGVCPKGTVTVNWGDGSTPDVLTGTSTSTVKWTPNHEYAAAGDYVITLTVEGEMAFSGRTSSNEGPYILRYLTSSDSRNRVYQNSLRKLEIGNSVTSIRDAAFYFCYSLASVAISDSVTSMGNNAFGYCCSLASITIPDSVTSIGQSALSYCYSLASVVISNSVTTIAAYTFQNCYSLASINIPVSVTSIKNDVFNNCMNLANVVVPGSVMRIEGYTFYGCSGVKFFDFTKHTAVPTLSNTNAFSSIPSDCEIRVPAALADEWKAATNWSTYADYIVGV